MRTSAMEQAFQLPFLGSSHSGAYWCIVTNAQGSIASDIVTLTVEGN
jgi:hypothetical protein